MEVAPLSAPQSDRALKSIDEDAAHEEKAVQEKSMDKLTLFALQLVEEFMTQHQFQSTLSAMQVELQQQGIPRPDSQLWFEMHSNCRGVLGQKADASGSTLEKLVAFCVAPRKLPLDIAPPVTLCLASPQPNSTSRLKQKAFSLRQAQTQMLSPVVRPSQRRAQKLGSSPSTPATGARNLQNDVDVDERPPPSELGPVETPQKVGKKHKPKKKRNHERNNNKVSLQHTPHPSRTESSIVMAYDEQIKRDLTSYRFLARELRTLRTERATCDTILRGSASQEAALARYDPYANELVRERYGFIQRVECALCTFSFLPVNLPHRVSFKCIMDLHKFWGYEPPQLAARYRPPLCYDAVSVCRMCGPILFERTTATLNNFDDPPSPTIRRAASLNALENKKKLAEGEQSTFCSDPYALPPLFGDDVIENGEQFWIDETSVEVRGNGVGGGSILESPGKAIVYSQQMDTAAFMSSKEWEVINPAKSNIRQVMEDSVKTS